MNGHAKIVELKKCSPENLPKIMNQKLCSSHHDYVPRCR